MLLKFNDYIHRYQEYFYSIDEIDLIILRGHLLIEEKMSEIIDEFVFHKKFILKAKLSFQQKIQIARSISLDESDNSMWALIGETNALRNKIVHTYPFNTATLNLNKIKTLFINEVEDLKDMWEKEGEKSGLKASISLCIGFLNTFFEEIVRFKEIILGLDKIWNPHRHGG